MHKILRRVRPIHFGPCAAPFVVLGLLIASCERTSPPVPPASPPPAPETPAQRVQTGHEKMLGYLEQLARDKPDLPYLGSSDARKYRKALTDLDDQATGKKRRHLHWEAGKAELRLGHIQAAIDHYRQVLELLTDDQSRGPSGHNIRFHLGVAYMRLAETENCCLRNTPESCIVPIRGGGLHTQVEGSTKAIEYFQQVLEQTDADQDDRWFYLSARWLLNIAYMTLGRYPDGVPEAYLVPSSIFESSIEFPKFSNIAAKLGLNGFNLAGGVIVDDFDNDDYLDIVTSTWDASGQIRFFRNNRDGTFSDRTESAGLTGLYGGLNLVQADYDNDGHLDILVLRGAWMSDYGRHPNSLIRNNGDGTFTDMTFEAGLGEVQYPTQTAAWADGDNDGDLDLFIGNETDEYIRAPCQLFSNNGDGTFTDIAPSAGLACQGFIKGVSWGDYDNDRYPDLYLSDNGRSNRLYRNNGNGTYSEVARKLGVTKPTHSFPTWFWDYDNDGALDIFVASYDGSVALVASNYLGMNRDYESSCLYRGNGNGGFEEVAKEHNLNCPIIAMGSNFGDLNNDGYLDMYLGTGSPKIYNLIPNLMFLNQEGSAFSDVSMAGGFGHLQKGHAVAFADLDNDGDLDVFEQMGGAYPCDKYSDALFENPGFNNHWITIKLVGVDSNRSAIGARIHVQVTENGKTRSVYRHVNSGGSFGANPLRQTIGLAKATRLDLLEIFWPTTGKTQTFRDLAADRTIQITESDPEYVEIKLDPLSL